MAPDQPSKASDDLQYGIVEGLPVIQGRREQADPDVKKRSTIGTIVHSIYMKVVVGGVLVIAGGYELVDQAQKYLAEQQEIASARSLVTDTTAALNNSVHKLSETLPDLTREELDIELGSNQFRVSQLEKNPEALRVYETDKRSLPAAKEAIARWRKIEPKVKERKQNAPKLALQ